jgi:hypothetical protein
MELVGSVFVLGVVGHATCTLIANGSKTFSREALAARLQTDLASAQSIFQEDMQTAGYSPDGMAQSLGTFQEVKSGTFADRVEFIADVDSDGVSDLVTYELVEGSLQRGIYPWDDDGWQLQPAEVLATGVQSFRLTFLDGSRNALTASQVLAGGTDVVRGLQLSMTVSGTSKSGAVAKTLFGEVSFRN